MGIYPANLATVAWCTAMVLAIDRQLSPAPRRFRASACWCAVSLGLRSNRVLLGLAAMRRSFARLRIRCPSSSASADKKAWDATVDGLGEIEVVELEDLHRGPALVHALDDADAVSHRSGVPAHADSTNTSPVPG